MGAGIVGAAAARELAVRGVDVLLLDAGDVSSGTTGLGEGNVLCSDKDAGPELDLCVAGRALFDELGEEARIRRKGALVVHPDAATWEAEPARLERLRAAGVEGRLVAADEVVELEPLLTGPVHGASFFPDDLQCDPRAIARALAREVPDVRTGTRVAEIATSGPRLGRRARVGRADRGRRGRARGRPMERRPRGHRRPRAAGRAAQGPARAARRSGGRPAQGRRRLLSRVGGQRRGGAGDHDRGGDHVGGRRARRLEPRATRVRHRRRRRRSARRWSRARRACSRASPARPRVAAWAGLRPWLPGHLPAIGPSAAVEGLWVATGHEGAGVALGPITGRLVAQAYCGEPLALDLEPFAPDRFSGAAATAA